MRLFVHLPVMYLTIPITECKTRGNESKSQRKGGVGDGGWQIGRRAATLAVETCLERGERWGCRYDALAR